MAMPKLMSVPIKMYSVSFRCLDSFKSPNLKTDFAVIKKPTASQWLNMMKIKTKIIRHVAGHLQVICMIKAMQSSDACFLRLTNIPKPNQVFIGTQDDIYRVNRAIIITITAACCLPDIVGPGQRTYDTAKG